MCRNLYIHDPAKKLTGRQMAELLFCGSSVLQHGGQDGGGFADSSDDGEDGFRIRVGKYFGLVSSQHDPRQDPHNPFRDKLLELSQRKPFKALSFLRYATAGPANDLVHYPPQYIDELDEGRVVCAMNGDIPSLAAERLRLQQQDITFYSQNDSELMLRAVCFEKKCHGCTRAEAIQRYMQRVPGAYSGILMTRRSTYLVRDPWGFRPLVVGLIDGRIIVAASESCALDMLHAKFAFEVKRGEIVEIANDGTMTHHAYLGEPPKRAAKCLFELNYFANPASRVFIDDRQYADVYQKGTYAYELGKQLASEHPVNADFVAPLPNSGDMAALGFHKRSGLNYKGIFIRNIFIPRTFIMSQQQVRELLVNLKFALMDDVFRKQTNKRVCIVDDSIVRSTTMSGIVDILREAGAEEVHLRISFPPITDPCYMGIAMPTKKELIASSMDVSQIQEHLHVDSLGYLSEAGVATVLKSRGDDIADYCTACFTGKYPVPVPRCAG